MQTTKSYISRLGFTLVEIMIVVLIITILLAIAAPNFFQAREVSRATSCVANLRAIDSAKERWAIDRRAGVGSPCSEADLAPPYLQAFPHCTATSNAYTVGDIGTSPTCSVGTSLGPKLAHVLP